MKIIYSDGHCEQDVSKLHEYNVVRVYLPVAQTYDVDGTPHGDPIGTPGLIWLAYGHHEHGWDDGSPTERWLVRNGHTSASLLIREAIELVDKEWAALMDPMTKVGRFTNPTP